MTNCVITVDRHGTNLVVGCRPAGVPAPVALAAEAAQVHDPGHVPAARGGAGVAPDGGAGQGVAPLKEKMKGMSELCTLQSIDA